jgi:uncharacterized membrane protein
MKRIFRVAVLLSFAWNLALVVGVVLNAGYALPRAAGGQFESFPMGIRLLYISTTFVVLYQIYVYLQIMQNKSVKPVWVPKAFAYLGLVSVFMNAISRSTQEQINVIPASIIAVAFLIA